MSKQGQVGNGSLHCDQMLKSYRSLIFHNFTLELMARLNNYRNNPTNGLVTWSQKSNGSQRCNITTECKTRMNNTVQYDMKSKKGHQQNPQNRCII